MGGVRLSNNTGAGNLLWDLGSVSIFNNLVGTSAGAVVNVNTGMFISGGSGASGINGIGNLGADLTAQFGASWATLNDTTSWNAGKLATLFGFVGVGTGNTVFVSNTSLTSWANITSGQGGGVKSAVDTMGLAGYDGQISTANSNFTVSQTGTGSDTWNGHVYNQQPADFTLFSSVPGAQGQQFDGNLNQTFYLDKLVPGAAGVTLGFFTINSSGNITYTVVPEPATYQMLALGALGLTGLLILRRRRAARA